MLVGMKVKIESIHEGNGVSYVGEKTVQIPKALLNETVEIEEIRRKKRAYFARVKKIKGKSRDRKKAKCPHFNVCQGCSLQNVSYAKQLQMKQKQMEDLFFPHAVEGD